MTVDFIYVVNTECLKSHTLAIRASDKSKKGFSRALPKAFFERKEETFFKIFIIQKTLPRKEKKRKPFCPTSPNHQRSESFRPFAYNCIEFRNYLCLHFETSVEFFVACDIH